MAQGPELSYIVQSRLWKALEDSHCSVLTEAPVDLKTMYIVCRYDTCFCLYWWKCIACTLHPLMHPLLLADTRHKLQTTLYTVCPHFKPIQWSPPTRRPDILQSDSWMASTQPHVQWFVLGQLCILSIFYNFLCNCWLTPTFAGLGFRQKIYTCGLWHLQRKDCNTPLIKECRRGDLCKTAPVAINKVMTWI